MSAFRDQMATRQQGLAALQPGNHIGPLMESRNPVDYLGFKDDPHVFCYTDLVELTGDATRGLILSQLVYWNRRGLPHLTDGRQPIRARAIVDGALWYAGTHAEFAIQTGLSQSKVKRGLHKLREDRLIVCRRHQAEGRTQTLLALHDEFTTHFRSHFRDRPLKQVGTTVFGTTVGMVGSTASALVLSQLCYWSGVSEDGRCRMRVHRNGHFWIAKTYADLGSEIGMTSRQTRTALKRLVEAGLVIKHNAIFAGRRMVHLRIDTDVFSESWVARREVEIAAEREW